MLSAIGGWLFAYMFPGLSVLSVIRFFPQYRAGTLFRGLVVHSGLLLSTIFSQYLLYASGRGFPWVPHPATLVLFTGIAAAVLVVLGRFGFFYALSALLQQLTMTSIAYYLLGSLPFLLIVVLIVPFYALSHLLQPKYWHVKIPATLLWGLLSLALFAARGDVFLNASLHAITGSFFIHKGIMYPHTEFAIRRARKKFPDEFDRE
ncbi:MAG: hypothetical protein HY435_00755 [Candidatus Liptonbacteria bacterium]|nr:hypothetical protein [Candidatus Liptonbacteria bacterium]